MNQSLDLVKEKKRKWLLVCRVAGSDLDLFRFSTWAEMVSRTVNI